MMEPNTCFPRGAWNLLREPNGTPLPATLVRRGTARVFRRGAMPTVRRVYLEEEEAGRSVPKPSVA
jgi:hypothetical protein